MRGTLLCCGCMLGARGVGLNGTNFIHAVRVRDAIKTRAVINTSLHYEHVVAIPHTHTHDIMIAVWVRFGFVCLFSVCACFIRIAICVSVCAFCLFEPMYIQYVFYKVFLFCVTCYCRVLVVCTFSFELSAHF